MPFKRCVESVEVNRDLMPQGIQPILIYAKNHNCLPTKTENEKLPDQWHKSNNKDKIATKVAPSAVNFVARVWHYYLFGHWKCYDFPFFSFLLYIFRSSFHSIPFGPNFLSIPMSLIHEAFLVSLIYDSQALRLTSFHLRHCLAQPSTALWLTLTPFLLVTALPRYFPSVWLTVTRPLSFLDNP